MPSIGSYTRQIPTGLAFYAPDPDAGDYFELVPTDSYNPNYAGVMTPLAGDALTQLTAYLNASGGGGNGVVMRDMGKTVRAPSAAAPTVLNFYREYQILKPAGVTAFGIQGSSTGPSANSSWVTVYLPSLITGAQAATLRSVNPVAGGQL